MAKRVVITGLGCISPLGNQVTDLWNNLLAGKSGVAPITHYDTSDYKTIFAAEVKDFDGAALFGSREARRMDRFSQFAVAAATQAVQHARSGDQRLPTGTGSGWLSAPGLAAWARSTNKLVSMVERGPNRVSPFLVPMMLPDTAPGMVAIHLGVRGPNMAVVTACATGTNCVGEAAEIIRRGQADVILAGGSEAAIVPIAMAGMSVMGALSTRNDDPERASRPFDQNRDGFVMGEGAAVLVLEDLEHAQQRGATILAEVAGLRRDQRCLPHLRPCRKRRRGGCLHAPGAGRCRPGHPRYRLHQRPRHQHAAE